MLDINCPACHAVHRVADEYLGARYTCNLCGTPIEVPSVVGEMPPPLPVARTEHAAQGPQNSEPVVVVVVSRHRWVPWVLGVIASIAVVFLQGFFFGDDEPDTSPAMPPAVERRPAAPPVSATRSRVRRTQPRRTQTGISEDPTGDKPPSVSLSISPSTARPGDEVILTMEAQDDIGLKMVWFWTESSPQPDVKAVAKLGNLGGIKKEYREEIRITAPETVGKYVYQANARDTAYPNPGKMREAGAAGKTSEELREMFPGLGHPHQASEGAGMASVTLTVVE